MGSGSSSAKNKDHQSNNEVKKGMPPVLHIAESNRKSQNDMHKGENVENINNSNIDLQIKQEKVDNSNNSNKDDQKKQEDISTNEKKSPSSGSSNVPARVEQKVDSDNSPQKKDIPDASKSVDENAKIVFSIDTIENKDQEKFDSSLKCSCLLTKPDALIKAANGNVTTLSLTKALPHTISLGILLSKLKNLQVLEIPGNQLGPQAFRSLMLALANNSTISVLNVADNKADTDTAKSIGTMLLKNRTLLSLDLSGNHLGKDFFSRCVGPSLAQNNVLQVLKCENIGSTDLSVLVNCLKENKTITTLNLSNNQLSNGTEFIHGISQWLKFTECCLQHLNLKNCNLKSATNYIETLQNAIGENSSLLSIDISGNQVENLGILLNLVVSCCSKSTAIDSFKSNDMKDIKETIWQPSSVEPRNVSNIKSLSLCNCHLNDAHLKSLLITLGEGMLANLSNVEFSSNPDITVTGLGALSELTKGENVSGLGRLTLGLNKVDYISEVLQKGFFPKLNYLNLRKCTVSSDTLSLIGEFLGPDGIDTLILDGIKFSGSDLLENLLGKKEASLAALSLSGCQLIDKDVIPIVNAVKRGMPLYMLKVSGNRLEDEFLMMLMDALKSQKKHPLALVDASNNKISSLTCKKIADFYASNGQKSNLHSLNFSHNNIDSDGVASLVGKMGKKSPLLSANFSNQQCLYEETDMENIFRELTKAIGITFKMDNDHPSSGSASLPNIPATFALKFLNLGGSTGELGQMIDSIAIATDFENQRICSLILNHAFEIAGYLQGNEKGECVFSKEEWDEIIGTGKQAPTWLQIPEHHCRSVYLAGLPASITVQKLEGLLEMEADCSVDEIYLVKDMVTQKNNGMAWILLSDEASVQKAVDFYNSGEARVFGNNFVISPINVTVDNDANAAVLAKASEDMKQRQSARQKEEASHRRLIQSSYQESQERHAYRLAHPAYADGRIW